MAPRIRTRARPGLGCLSYSGSSGESPVATASIALELYGEEADWLVVSLG